MNRPNLNRFDARGYLQDLHRYEVNQTQSKDHIADLSNDEKDIENACEEERFKDLLLAYEEENHHEEEMKRLRAALAADGAYHETQFNYDAVDSGHDGNTEDIQTEAETVSDEEKLDPFIMPSGLDPPDTYELPKTMKLYSLMEKTAVFISSQGAQMEILIKARQSGNPQFDFLAFDSNLNPFYKYLISMIKSGKYAPKSDEKSSMAGSSGSDDEEENEDSDDDGHYLHPSLLGSLQTQKTPSKPFILPNLPRSENETNAYSVLVNSLKDKIPIENEENEMRNENSSKINNITNQDEKLTNTHNWPSLLPTPPSDVELIIEKLAQYVVKNGEEFETTVRNRGEERFEFLNPGSMYHAHYIRKKLLLLEEKRRSQAEELLNKHTCMSKDEHERNQNKGPISFSFNSKEKKSTKEKSSTENETKDKDDKSSREKQLQEERKKKAMLFIKMLQSKQLLKEENESESGNEIVYGPTLPDVEIPVIPDDNDNFNCNTNDGNNLNDNYNNEEDIHSKISVEVKPSSVLPFVASDQPLKKSHSKHSHSRHSSSSRSHRRDHHHSSSSRSYKSRRSRSRSRSRSSSNSKSHYRSHRRKRSRSRSRSRSRDERRNKTRSKSRSRSRSKSNKR